MIQKFKAADGDFHTQPTRCPKGPHRAKALKKLLRLNRYFRSFLRDRTAYYLDGNVTRPLTSHVQCSYAELAGASEAEFFVSHFWGTAFDHFCTSLRKHSRELDTQEDAAYWVCFISNNQYDIKGELGATWKESSFYLALTSGRCVATCMVLDELALPMTRAWCIFEVVQTLLLQQADPNFQGLLFCTETGVLNHGEGSVEVSMNLARRMAALDLEDAEASSKEDKTMIDGAVCQLLGGFDQMNSMVRNHVGDMLTRAEAKFLDEVRTIKDQLHNRDAAVQKLESSQRAASMHIEERMQETSAFANLAEVELATTAPDEERRSSRQIPFLPAFNSMINR